MPAATAAPSRRRWASLATQQYQRITQKPDEKAVTVWVAPARNNLPVQIRVSEDGVTLEQRLVRASVKD